MPNGNDLEGIQKPKVVGCLANKSWNFELTLRAKLDNFVQTQMFWEKNKSR